VIKNGNGTVPPGFGIHFVFELLTV